MIFSHPSSVISTMAALAVLTFAQDSNSDSSNVNQCISPHACWINATDAGVSYCIQSPWTITYPGLLRHGLTTLHDPAIIPLQTSSGAQTPLPAALYNTTTPTSTLQTVPFDSCGWNYGTGYSRQLVYRGDIYYKVTNLTGAQGPFTDSLAYRPNDLLADVTGAFDVMHNTYPVTEIMLILLFCLILPVLAAVSPCLLPMIKVLRNGAAAIVGFVVAAFAVVLAPFRWAGRGCVRLSAAERQRRNARARARDARARADVEKGDADSGTSGGSTRTGSDMDEKAGVSVKSMC